MMWFMFKEDLSGCFMDWRFWEIDFGGGDQGTIIPFFI